MELGGGLGGAFYIGDANSKPFANLGPMGSIVARYIFNPRMAIKGNLAVGHISGDTGADFFPQDAGSGDAAGGARGTATFKRNVIDIGAHRVTIDDEERPLTAAEWRILTYLAGNEGRLVSRSEILEKCFDYALDSYERVVDTHIKNIRAKLRPGAWIETVRGYGYRFCPYGEDDE